ncbi:uncharacterized protein ACA1_256600 [Acanthamoeba castellanii str. Neff]|uniref:DUF642 domain-containing protein n=1 Tax=Acanthamoeba castellanii (strain ATCC 30010 / Neff) TaxID=1257118 RepID=L8GH50_ACACF|nr:uncharacterized protein ACA1_256600 [Acanthamoeba castellanii str. Neff]ELR11521.1 hypothetical protein ACA1_256600 [Acanthamoeba castellanii str. Neff]
MMTTSSSTPLVLITVLICAIFAISCARGEMVVNGQFTTDLSGWTVTTGAYSGYLKQLNGQCAMGSVGGLGNITQTLATTSGATYTVRFTLGCSQGTPNAFLAKFGGSTLLSLINGPAQAQTQYCRTVAVRSTSTVLFFGARHDPAAYLLDDPLPQPHAHHFAHAVHHPVAFAHVIAHCIAYVYSHAVHHPFVFAVDVAGAVAPIEVPCTTGNASFSWLGHNNGLGPWGAAPDPLLGWLAVNCFANAVRGVSSVRSFTYHLRPYNVSGALFVFDDSSASPAARGFVIDAAAQTIVAATDITPGLPTSFVTVVPAVQPTYTPGPGHLLWAARRADPARTYLLAFCAEPASPGTNQYWFLEEGWVDTNPGALTTCADGAGCFATPAGANWVSHTAHVLTTVVDYTCDAPTTAP